MDANTVTFGIEIECAVDSGCCRVGNYTGPGLHAEWLPTGWKVKSDSSVRTSRAGKMGVEFVSPVLRGADGLRSLVAAVATIKAHGGVVVNTGGVHIHVGFPRANVKAMERMLHLAAESETAIYATTGTLRRQEGDWCRSVRRHGEAGSALQRMSGDRYHLLNVRPWTTRQREAVEFRAFPGSLDPAKLIAYVRMCVGLVERAHKTTRKATWGGYTPKAGSAHERPGQQGLTALNRLFYRLGWTRGMQATPFGAVATDAQDLPGLKDHKKVLRRLAKKYDAAGAQGED